MENRNIYKRLVLIFVFGMAMGFLESVVVVYLRYMFYPHGFNFPLSLIPDSIVIPELAREFCTLIMLLTLAWIAGKNKIQIFAYFLYSFAVWDIFYYVGLKLFLGWPSSLLTWDILFLIPMPWLGPVLSPVLASVTMILLALVFLKLNSQNKAGKVKIIEWFLIYSGAAIIFASYTWDYTRIIISNNLLGKLFELSDNEVFQKITTSYVPAYYHWDLFILGILFVYISMFMICKRAGIFVFKSSN